MQKYDSQSPIKVHVLSGEPRPKGSGSNQCVTQGPRSDGPAKEPLKARYLQEGKGGIAFCANLTQRRPILDKRPLHRRIYFSLSQCPTFHTQYMMARVFLPGHTKNQNSTPMLVQTAGLLCRMQAHQRSGGFWNALVAMFSIHIGLQRTPRGQNGIKVRRRARRSTTHNGGSIRCATSGLHICTPCEGISLDYHPPSRLCSKLLINTMWR